MATTTTTTSAAPAAAVSDVDPSPIVETGGFEEDDEFEEFEEDGEFAGDDEPPTWMVCCYDDWTNIDEIISLTDELDWPVADEAAREDEWDEDWDDDLVEGDFVTQLRQELQATANQGK